MKIKVISIFAVISILTLAIAAFAYNRSATTVADAADCCKDRDACPMKSKGHVKDGDHAGKSCPMKEHGDAHAKTEGKACCGCCGDSCPMKKEKETVAAAVSTADGEKKCCDCACCSSKGDKSA